MPALGRRALPPWSRMGRGLWVHRGRAAEAGGCWVDLGVGPICGCRWLSPHLLPVPTTCESGTGKARLAAIICGLRQLI